MSCFFYLFFALKNSDCYDFYSSLPSYSMSLSLFNNLFELFSFDDVNIE